MAADHSHSFVRPFSFVVGEDFQPSSFRELSTVSLHFEQTYLDPVYSHGFSGCFSYLPFRGHLGLYDCSLEPAFIRKRNERERQRVRCVNEGYARLREHLPHQYEDKRLSKVETLRAAISYIKHLQNVLELHLPDAVMEMSPGTESNSVDMIHLTESSSDEESRKTL